MGTDDGDGDALFVWGVSEVVNDDVHTTPLYK